LGNDLFSKLDPDLDLLVKIPDPDLDPAKYPDPARSRSRSATLFVRTQAGLKLLS
jgi:hypothetical protein